MTIVTDGQVAATEAGPYAESGYVRQALARSRTSTVGES